ncbi:MAG: T9SS type A sorting domain-containing protein [Vicingaceae bacterium]
MKQLAFIFSILFSIVLQAQPLDTTVTDCNNNSKSIQAVLSTGKAILIAHKGVDCSICVAAAPALQTFAAQNSAKVEVWGAMTYKYSPNVFSNPCDTTTNWKINYGWTDIFTFPDNNRAWFSSGTPRYYVYSPRDSSIVYSGSNQTQASNRAIAESTVGLNINNRPDPVEIYGFDGSIYLRNLPKNVNAVRLIDLQGRVLEEVRGINQGNLSIKELKNGIYIIQLEEGQYRRAQKVAVY